MNTEELELQKALVQINQGCYDHLMCWCLIYVELEKLRSRLGPANFEMFREALFMRACYSCGIPTPKPGTTIPTTVVLPPQIQPPTPPPQIEVQPPSPRLRCTPMTADQLENLSSLDIREKVL